MTQVSDSVLNDMLRHLPKEQQKTLSNIIAGKVTHQVRCEGACKGEIIAYIYADGINQSTRQPQSRVEPATVDGLMKLRASRKRLDGELGFQCWCGNDSRISPYEAGDLTYDGQPPTKSGLEAIWSRLQKNSPSYNEVDGIKTVDGFSIERVSS